MKAKYSINKTLSRELLFKMSEIPTLNDLFPSTYKDLLVFIVRINNIEHLNKCSGQNTKYRPPRIIVLSL